jgi:hypothetical protein
LERRRLRRTRAELDLIVTQRLRAKVEAMLDPAVRVAVDEGVDRGELDPWSAADRLLAPLDA